MTTQNTAPVSDANNVIVKYITSFQSQNYFLVVWNKRAYLLNYELVHNVTGNPHNDFNYLCPCCMTDTQRLEIRRVIEELKGLFVGAVTWRSYRSAFADQPAGWEDIDREDILRQWKNVKNCDYWRTLYLSGPEYAIPIPNWIKEMVHEECLRNQTSK